MTRSRALITGGSAGIGLAIGRMLAAEGWALTLCARKQAGLDRAARELGGDVHTIPANLAEPGAAAQLAQAHLDHWGGLELLVSNAGVGLIGPIEQRTAKSLDLELAVNLRSPYLLLQACIPALREAAASSGRSNAVLVSSLAARYAPPNAAAYAATKAALVALANSAHAELSRDGIQVSALLPGLVDTPGTTWAADAARESMMDASDVTEAVRFLLRVSPRCFIPEIVLTTAGPSVHHSPVDWAALAAG